ncbi:MAG: hypothetical protein U1F29_17985 [Planctomycetota bacterium]
MHQAKDRVDFSHPANGAVLECLGRFERLPRYERSAPRGRVDEWELGAHPDLVGVLWDEVDAELPERCAWIVHGRPALVHPKTGIVFGFVAGTKPIVLRVPLAQHGALGLDGNLQVRFRLPDASACEPDWLAVPFERVRELARVAFEAAS